MASVLIADDDVDVADAWRRALELDGHEITIVHDGQSAVQELKAKEFDVVLTDVVMPEGGGLVVSGIARVARGAPKVLVVSAHLNGDIGGRAKLEFLKNLGVKHILTKPADIDEISAIVAQLAGEKADKTRS